VGLEDGNFPISRFSTVPSHYVLYCGLLVGRRDHMKWSAALRAETNLIIDAHTFAPVNQEGVTGSKCKDKNILITGDLPLSSMFICSDSVNFKDTTARLARLV